MKLPPAQPAPTPAPATPPRAPPAPAAEQLWSTVAGRKKKRPAQTIAAVAGAPRPPPPTVPTSSRGPALPKGSATRQTRFIAKNSVVLAYQQPTPESTPAGLRRLILTSVRPLLKSVSVLSMRSCLRDIAFLLECASSTYRDQILKLAELRSLGLVASAPLSPVIRSSSQALIETSVRRVSLTNCGSAT